MTEIVDIVLPVFCLIAFGYLAARFEYLPKAAGDGLAEFVVRVAVPILLMRSIATAEFGDVNPWAFLAVYAIGIVIAWIAATALIAGVFGRGYRASVIAGVSASFSNLVLLGIPLIERAYGQEGLQVLFFLVSFHLPFMVTVSTFLMEHAVRADGVEKSPLRIGAVAKSLAINLARNPIVIGIFLGGIWRITGIEVGNTLTSVMDLIARTTGPLALFSLGMGLIKYGIRGNLVPAAGIAFLSLMLMPATVYIFGTYVLPLPPLWFKVALLAASAPTGMNAYLFATYFKIAEGLATNTVVLATLGAIITIPFWLSMV